MTVIERWTVRRCPGCGRLAVAGLCYGTMDEPHDVLNGEPIEVVAASQIVGAAEALEAIAALMQEIARAALDENV